MIKRILVGLDGSSLAESILPYVEGLARGLNAEVLLCSVVHVPTETQELGPHATLDQVLERDRTSVQNYLYGPAQRLSTAGLTVRTIVSVGDGPDEIVRLARSEGADLIALATHGRSGFQRWVHGSVAEEVMHTAATPVLLVRPQDRVVSRSVQQIVVPLDGSPLAEAALAQAEALATALQKPITLLRVVEPVYLTADPAMGIISDYGDLLDDMRRAAQDYLDAKAAEVRGRGLTVNIAAPTGTPASEIVDYAQAHFGSLVVIATHGRTGVAGMLLGSVARRVAQQSGAPTLLVRPNAER